MKMESPPSSSTWSEAFILSDDSGLLLTSSSISSSGSASGDSRSGPKRLHLELQDSDCEEKSLSQDDSLDGMSDIICGENFNTLKKGPHWITELPLKTSPIEPPPEFQDKPVVAIHVFESFAEKFAATIVSVAVKECYETELKCLKLLVHRPLHHVLTRAYWTPDFLPFSPCHGGRPSSRSSLGSSRLSSSHNSLSVPTAHRVDDSSFITQAVSHDTLTFNPISDLYNVPFDSDVYAVPVDVVKPPLKPRRNQQHKKRRRNTSSGCREIESRHCKLTVNKKSTVKCDRVNMCTVDKVGKRHSIPSTSAITDGEPIHMTLQEVRQYLQTLYSSSSDSSDHKDKINNIKPKNTIIVTNNNNNNKYTDTSTIVLTHKPINGVTNSSETHKSKKNTFLINIKNKKVKDSCDNVGKQQISVIGTNKHEVKRKKSPAKLFSLKQTLCNMFRFRKFMSPEHLKNEHKTDSEYESNYSVRDDETHSTITNRALPPLPSRKCEDDDDEQVLDFATSIHKVKDYGWYWGPLSSEAAEKILSNEPDGSFIVRDSSDDHYIFSLTFKLNNSVRHVRIEHDQGNFSFGSCTKFKSQTIVEFIENAVEHSRSGRYLFFLHRRPVIGPVRVQLLHPVSRFKQIQSLQHMCRFIILKAVRRDLIPSLPLPRRMIDYLNTPHYYSEHLIDIEECDETNVTQPIRTVLTDVVPPQRHNNIETHIEWPPNPDVPVNNYVLINNPATNPNTFNDTRQS